MEFLIISGLSGSGKSSAAAVLEDIGFYIVDNLPAEMMVKFAEFCADSGSRYDRVAMVYDVRAGEPFEKLIEALDSIRGRGLPCRMLFMHSDTGTLINRYKETRRTHPLAAAAGSLEGAIALERQMMQCLQQRADIVLDTTAYSTAKQRSVLLDLFGKSSDRQGLAVTVTSFGYKYGLPMEADLVFDVRCLPNPYYVPELREKTGLEKEVADFIFASPQTGILLDKLADLLCALLPLYREEGKSVLVIGIGCTGGHHRSVAITHALVECLQNTGFSVTERHRDMSR